MFKKISNNKPLDKNQLYADSIAETSLWNKIRKSLVGIFDKYADIHYVSRLVAKEDQATKQLHLSAPSYFVRERVQANYLSCLERLCEKFGYQLSDLAVGC
jgi:hypothetical protein